MATDYDAPRKNDEELREDSIEELQSRRTDTQSAVVDEDEQQKDSSCLVQTCLTKSSK